MFGTLVFNESSQAGFGIVCYFEILISNVDFLTCFQNNNQGQDMIQ